MPSPPSSQGCYGEHLEGAGFSALCKAVIALEGWALPLSSGDFPTRRESEHSADTWEILDRALPFVITTTLLTSGLLSSGGKGH